MDGRGEEGTIGGGEVPLTAQRPRREREDPFSCLLTRGNEECGFEVLGYGRLLYRGMGRR